MKKDKKLDKKIHSMYVPNNGDWVKPDEKEFESLNAGNTGKSRSTYGELTYHGVEMLIKKFKTRFEDPEGVFYDLGSGHGRVVNHVALRCENLKKSCGVELCSKRYASATKLSGQLEYPGVQPEFLNKNFFDHDYSDATIAYIDNTVYPYTILPKIFDMLPADCVIVYKAGWITTNDPVLTIETTYNKILPKDTIELVKYTMSRAGWRYAGGFEF